MKKVTDGVIDVIVYPNMSDKTKNRGFAFVEYESHRAAAMARRKLIPGKIQLWNHQIAVDWAEPEQEVDDDIMSRVCISWRRGAVGRVSDSRSRGRGFESRPGTRRKNSGHVSHTYVPLFTNQYKLVPAKER